MFVSTALKNFSTVAVGTAAIALSFGSAVRAASLYNITRIRPPESPFIANLATDINENGEVIGSDLNAGGRINSVFLWDRTTGARLLFAEESRFLIADAINNTGLIVGTNLVGLSSVTRAILWDANGIPQKLPPLETNPFGLYRDEANDINNRGQIVGSSISSGGILKAVLWENNQTADLGIAGRATAINESSWIVGNANATGAFLWKNGQITDLGDLSFANDINDLGQVVGSSTCGSSTCASIWENGILTQFGEDTKALEINNLGWVVGSTLASDFREERALLWKNGQAIDLNTLIDPSLGWTLFGANAINDKGQIVGYGKNPSTPGFYEAFLLTPVEESTSVPESTPLLGLAVMGAGLAFYRRYRR